MYTYKVTSNNYNKVVLKPLEWLLKNRCEIHLSVINNKIRLYFEYMKEENEINQYIKKHIRLTEEYLIGDLLRMFNKYGLGDI